MGLSRLWIVIWRVGTGILQSGVEFVPLAGSKVGVGVVRERARAALRHPEHAVTEMEWD